MNDVKKFGRINIIHITALTVVYAAVVLLIMRFEYAYGSNTDWGGQHYAIPDYFRKLFYETGDIFPSFAANLGAGENIYNFSYYGLYSPIILISYLLPFVKMPVYIQAVSIIGMEISILLFYRFMRAKFRDSTAFLMSLAFLCAAPLIYHGHRHIMFVSYMPFLILALGSADSYFEKGKKSGLIFWTLMIILSSWFFSVSALAVLLVYGAYRYISLNDKIKPKELLKAGVAYTGKLLIPVMLAGVLLLPTAAALLSGRDSANVKTDWIKFLPQFKLNYIGMSTYSMGLSCFAVLSVAAALFSRDKARRFLGAVIAAVSFFPLIVYILNGTMYFDPKVLIPFIPLGIILLGQCYEEIIGRKKSYKVIFGVFLIVYAVGAVFYDGWKSTWEFMATDMLALSFCLCCFSRSGKKAFLWIAVTAVPFVSMLSFNLADKLIPLKTLEYENSERIEYLADIIAGDEKLVRSSCGIKRSDTVNMIYNTDYYSPYLYSSIHHKGYNSFYFNEMRNENEYRNSALTTRSSNILFNIFMGNKYLITDGECDEAGYELEKSSGVYRLYKNDAVLPVGRSTDRVISETEYLSLNYVQRMEALVNCIVADSADDGEAYESSVEQYGEIKLTENENIGELQDGWRIKSSSDFTAAVKLPQSVPKDKILVIEMRADNKTGKRKDISVSVNGIKNTLTDPEWKYYNKNTVFEYVLTSGGNESLTELEFKFGAGDYTISEITAYTLDYPEPYYDELIFDKEKTKGDVMEGSIECSSDGYFELTVPYDDGFEIYVDGKKQDYEKVNTAFIGFPISKGSHSIRIVYTAPMLHEGMAVSAAGLLICGVMAASELKKRRSGIKKSCEPQ
ncbi:YfhO family protein [Ruminococcus sp. Marseille-P6503]|uniref:YfhO family protein n=1 Tax=Ruminococcus sp. Marseille-P6503 TaxID=2364796 RepID=UPI000F530142|nr:YfhO family protein [Ruminococcus sp. Marseille-P6503]